MPTTDEILLTFLGNDQVTPVVNNIQGSIEASASNMNAEYDSTFSRMASSANSTFDSIARGASSVNQAMMRLQSSSNQILGALGSTKSASELVFGTTSRADTNKVLINHMVQTQEQAESLYDTVDKITDGSLTSMQDLIPAMNAFKSATQATYQQLNDDVAGSMANFGAFVLAQTGSTELSLTAMMDLSKGIKGQFNALDQYGVSLASLESTGLWKQDTSGNGKKWKGDEKDIKGYLDAVNAVIGDTSDLMDTNEGLNAQIGKMWSRAGKRIGNEYLPQIKDLKSAFIDLDNEMGGQLSTNLLLISTGIEEISSASYKLDMMMKAFTNVRDLVMALASRWGILGGAVAENTVQTANNANTTLNNTQEIWANTDARYANADATYAQAQAMSEANAMMDTMPSYTPSSSGGDDGRQTGNTGGILTETGANIALDQAFNRQTEGTKSLEKNKGLGGLGEKTRNTNARKEIEGIQQATEDLKNKEKVLTAYNDELGDVENVLHGLGRAETQTDEYSNLLGWRGDVFKDEINLWQKGYTEALDSIEDSMDARKIQDLPMKMEKFGAKKSDPTSKFKMNTGATGVPVFQELIENNKAERDRASQILESGILNKGDDTLEATFEKLQTEDLGFFNKLSIWANEKKQRKLPDVDMTGGLDNLLTKMTDPLDTKLASGVTRLKQSYENLSTSFNQFKTLSFADKMETIFDFKGMASKLGLANAEALVVDGEMAVMDGEMAVINGTLATLTMESGVATGQLAIVDGELVVLDEEMGAVAVSSGVLATESEVAGTEMAVAETGVTWMGLAESGLASAFATLIVPTLAIAGVIAVLIPIIAGLAVEAMFFINLVGQVMSAMDWESIDVTGASESLQELATALAWMGVALASLSFASLLTGVTTLLTLGGNVELVVGQAVEMLTKTAEKINELGAIPPINPLIADNIQRLGGILNDVSSAMLSLSGVQLSSWIGGILTGFGLFGSLADSIDRAKSDIQHAIDSINSMSFTGIDESKVNQIKTTCDAIASFSEAFSGLTKIRGDDAWSDFTSWLLDGGFFGNGGKSIEQAFNEAHDDIVSASKALQQFTDISDIDQTTVDRLTKVGDSIGAMGTAFEGLRKMRDDGNWDSFVTDFAGGLFKGKDDIMSAFQNAKEDIVVVAQELKGFSGQLPKLPESLATKLKTIGETLTSVTDALNSLQTIHGLGGKKGINFTNFVTSIQQARKSLKKVGDELKKLGSGNKDGKGALVEIPEGLATKLKTLSKSLKSISDAITALSTIQQASAGGANFTNFVSTIEQAKDGLVQVSAKLKELDGDKNLQGVSDELVNKLKNLSKSLTSISDAITALSTLETQTGGTIDAESISQLIDDAKTALVKVSGKLKSLQNNKNFQAVGTELPGKIKNITSSLNKIIGALKSLRKLEALAGEGGINVEGVNTLIKDAKDAIVKVSSQLKSLQDNSDFQALDGTLGDKIKSVTKNVNKLSSFVNAMNTFPPNVDGEGIGTKVANAVTGVKKASSQLKKITQGDNVEGVSTILSNIKKSVNGLKNTIKAMSFNSSGQHIGLSLSKGVTSGLTGLTPRVTGAIGHTASAGGTRAYGVGSRIGKRLTSGFKAGLNLVDAINSEIDNLIQTMDSRAGEVESASNSMSGGGDIGNLFVNTDLDNSQSTGNGPGGSLDTLVSATNTMVRSMGNSNVTNQPLSTNAMNGLRNMSGQSQLNANNQPVNIIVSEGAVQLDARDLTVKESRQVMINALESLDMIKNIDLQY